MWNPFLSTRKLFTSSCLGVDIGTTSIKVVEISRGSQLPRITNYGFLESSDHSGRMNSALQASNLKLFENDVVGLLTSITSAMKTRTRDVVASMPLFSVFLTVLDLPQMTQEELRKAVTYQAQQYAPLPLSEVELEWIDIGGYEDDKGFSHKQVLVIFFPQEHIAKYQRICERAGLSLKAIEVEGVSIARSLVGTDPTPTLVMDIGGRATQFMFIEKGMLRFGAQTDFAGASLTQALATGLNINAIRAEDLKKERGIIGTGVEYELSTIMLPFLDVIINEAKKASYNYVTQIPSALKFERVILTGGGANLMGIEKYISRELGVPTVKGMPFLRCEYPSNIEPFVGELNALMSVSIGVCLRQFK